MNSLSAGRKMYTNKISLIKNLVNQFMVEKKKQEKSYLQILMYIVKKL
jgi:hypothetical protein